MPSKTFFNLPKEKQELLLESARKEFSRVSFYEASINQIIKEAGISRGSFYMYFDTKEELYRYLVEQFFMKEKQKLNHYLEKSNGDFIEALSLLYDDMLDHYHENEDSFFQKFMENMGSGMENLFSDIKEELKQEKWAELIDTSNWNLANGITKLDYIRCFQFIGVHTFCLFQKGMLTKEEAKTHYHELLLRMKFGFISKENGGTK